MENNGFVVVDYSRIQKAKKIIACLEFVMNEKLRNKRILEVGGGSGLISYEMSKCGNEVICIDLQDAKVKEATNKYGIQVKNYSNFLIADGTKLPFKSDCFDIIVCNQVIEHVPKQHQQQLIDNIYRVLKQKGLFYITTPNKIWPIEPHTKLPFLSYLPKKLAGKYIKLAKGINEYDVSLLTYNQLKDIVSAKFKTLIDLTPIIIKNAETFYIKSEIPNSLKWLLKIAPLDILRPLTPFYPSWILVGVKE